MGRTRNSGLESPRARSGLKKRIPAYWVRLGKGQHLGYRRGATGGFWLARFYDSKTHKRVQASLGFADDEDQPNGTDVLSFDQASDMARAWFKQVADEAKRASTPAPAPSPNKMTVIQAVESYIEYLYAEKKGAKQAESAARRYILSKAIGNRLVVQLTMDEIDAWRKGIADAPRSTRKKHDRKPVKHRKAKDGVIPKAKMKGKLELEAESKSPAQFAADQKQRRKSTANRVLTILKSALNRLVGADSSIDDRPWRNVAPFKNADGIRTNYLEVEEQRRLVEACPPGLKELVLGALYTGARYGELVDLRVGKVFPQTLSIRIEDSKTSTPRVIPLSQEGGRAFADLIKGKKKTDLVFTKPDGAPWGQSHVFRPLRVACDAAGVTPISFYELRHTYASLLVMAGAELTAVAEALGHKGTRTAEKHYRHLRKGWVHKQIEQFSPQLFPETDGQGQPAGGGGESKIVPFLRQPTASVPPAKTRRIGRVQYDAPGGPKKTWREEAVPEGGQAPPGDHDGGSHNP
jgi:integrase